ncbi:hypothetical protein HNV12_02625 [Methanococcoides sp. SA1]|nr:hypothetical protein [Methanococcoides sp. SA1]
MKDVKKFFVSNYKKCWEFLNESRWFIVFVFGLFALTFLIGFTFPIFFEAEIFNLIRELLLIFEGKGVWETIVLIFLNNLQASFMAMVLGIVFGVFPLVACVLNGYLLGFVARYAVAADGIFAMWKLLPHGIFELPAVLFSMGSGLKIGVSVFELWGSGTVKGNLKEGLRFFVFVVFPLLVVAAVIEGVLVGMG